MFIGIFKEYPAAIGSKKGRTYIKCPKWIGNLLFWWGKRKEEAL
jgi:hypothetical protein